MGFWSSVAFCLFLINGIKAKISIGKNENFLKKTEIASPERFLSALSDSGIFVFSGLGKDYTKALQTLRKSSPNCIQESLEDELEDGSRRFTTTGDSEITPKFPRCVQEDIESISKFFDKVDGFVMDVLRKKFNTSLHITTSNTTLELEDLPTKYHLAVYQNDLQAPSSNSTLSLPFHTDSGLYVLLTPSNLIPIRIINRNGVTEDLHTNDDSLIFLTGSGLSSWLLPEEALYAPPHGVPSLTNLTPLTRTVFARMKVAPLEATARHSEQTFGEHFYSSSTGTSPNNAKEARYQARLRRQVGRCPWAGGQSGIGQKGIGRLGIGQLGIGQLGIGQLGIGQLGIGQFQFAIGQLGIGQEGIGQGGIGRSRSRRGIGQAGIGQVGIGLRGIGQAGIGQFGIGRAGIGQFGIGRAGIGQFGIGQFGIGQAGIGRVGIGQK